MSQKKLKSSAPLHLFVTVERAKARWTLLVALHLSLSVSSHNDFQSITTAVSLLPSKSWAILMLATSN